MTPFLTIGIPTFKRSQAVSENTLSILSDDFLSRNDVGLVVSDNCSDDGTFEAISHIKNSSLSSANLSIFTNEKNLGVFGNIFRLFDYVDSDYLLITSDEDFIHKNHIPRLMNFLHEKRPSLVSPQVFRNDGLYRGRKVSRPIAPMEYQNATFYTSGLVFHVEATKSVIEAHRTLMMEENLSYKQTLIAAELMILHPGTLWFYDRPVTEKRYSLPTHVSSDRTFPFWSVPGRWESFVATENYFATRLSNEKDLSGRKALAGYLRRNRVDLYGLLLHAIKTDRPELINDFRFGVQKKEIGVGSLAGMISFARNVFRTARAAVRGLIGAFQRTRRFEI